MALAPTRHTLFAVKVGATTLKQMQSTRLSSGANKLLAFGDGMVDPTYATTNPAEPRFEFSGTAIAAMLNAVGISGLGLATGSVLDMWWQKRAQRGTLAPSASAVHRKRTITNGLVVPRRLNVTHGGVATLDYEVLIFGDGVNSPIIHTDNVALSGTPGVEELFTVGPMDLNGVRYAEGIQSYTLDFGITAMLTGGGGYQFPTHVSIGARMPVLTVRTLDAAVESLIGEAGAVALSSTNRVYLRKKAEGVGNLGDGTAEHISFTFNKGLALMSEGAAQHGGDAEFAGEYSPVSDGTNAIVVIDTACVIAA